MVSAVEKDIIIASLRKQLQELHQKCNALEDENALLNNEIERLKRLYNMVKKQD